MEWYYFDAWLQPTMSGGTWTPVDKYGPTRQVKESAKIIYSVMKDTNPLAVVRKFVYQSGQWQEAVGV